MSLMHDGRCCSKDKMYSIKQTQDSGHPSTLESDVHTPKGKLKRWVHS